MAKTAPELPAAYRLIHYAEIEDLRARAIKLAEAGAEEGTLIWASSQTNARGRLNQKWHCNDGDLHCTVILRPDFSAEKYPEVMIVAAVSMAQALATHLSAMTALGFRWPNDITIAGHKVASIWVNANRDQTSPWLAITISVNIENSLEDFSIAAISIKEAEGDTDLNSRLLLETYARQFITRINHWSERGMEMILQQWRARIEGIGAEKVIRLADGEIVGIMEKINKNGGVIMKLIDHSLHTVSLADFIEITESGEPGI